MRHLVHPHRRPNLLFLIGALSRTRARNRLRITRQQRINRTVTSLLNSYTDINRYNVKRGRSRFITTPTHRRITITRLFFRTLSRLRRHHVTRHITVIIISSLRVISIRHSRHRQLTRTLNAITFLKRNFFRTVTINGYHRNVNFNRFTIFFRLSLRLLISPERLPNTLFSRHFRQIVTPLGFFRRAFFIFGTTIHTSRPHRQAVNVTDRGRTTIFSPSMQAVLLTTAVFDLVATDTLDRVNVRHHRSPQVVIKVSRQFPHRRNILRQIQQVARRLMPTKVTMGRANINIPIPSAITSRFRGHIRRIFIRIQRVRLRHFRVQYFTRLHSPYHPRPVYPTHQTS